MSRVAGVGPEPVEPLLVYAAQQLVEPVGHARPIVERVAQTVEGAGDGLCLLCIDQLRDCREVYGVAAIAYCRPPECLGRSVILGWSKGHARGLSCLQRVEHGFLGLGHLRANERARLLRDVARDVAIDGDNEVGDTKERSRSARNEHRRHPKLIEEGSDAVDKGCDGFLVGTEVGAEITLPKNLTAGDYNVYLNLPDPYKSLSTRPEYSIRLANKEVWEPQTGYNKIHTIKIRN